MIDLSIPGFGDLKLKYLVLDYNGTLAFDGGLIMGVREMLRALEQKIEMHVLTADTFGCARGELKGFPCKVTVLEPDLQGAAKADYVRQLGPQHTAAIGNGRNDRLMLKEAALAIGVIQSEGAASETLQAAHIVLPDIRSALWLFLNPKRLIATLRS
jgi:soluble P-type ATPase